MKTFEYLILSALFSALATPVWSQNPATPKDASAPQGAGQTELTPELLENMETLDSETNQISYAIGVNIARNLQHNFPDANIDFFVLAIRDVVDGRKPRLSEDAINAGIVKYSEVAKRVARDRVERVADRNLRAAELFLDVNGKKPDVITTESGLQYRVIHQGAGPRPEPGSHVRFNCTTKLLDGRMISSTAVEGNRPLEVNLESAIPAWQEALPLMNMGSKWEIFTHPKLAYGEDGTRNVGPNEMLIFTIELVGIQQ